MAGEVDHNGRLEIALHLLIYDILEMADIRTFDNLRYILGYQKAWDTYKELGEAFDNE
jgi:hypothetical protein